MDYRLPFMVTGLRVVEMQIGVEEKKHGKASRERLRTWVEGSGAEKPPMRARARRAYLHAGEGYLPTCKRWGRDMPNCWRRIFLILLKNKDGEEICQIVGVALTAFKIHFYKITNQLLFIRSKQPRIHLSYMFPPKIKAACS
jgi:hypothetical protein